MSDWKPYTGEYDKRWYDVKRTDGRVAKDCYPNAGFFHPADTDEYIPGHEVAEIKETDDPIWRSIDAEGALTEGGDNGDSKTHSGGLSDA